MDSVDEIFDEIKMLYCAVKLFPAIFHRQYEKKDLGIVNLNSPIQLSDRCQDLFYE